MKLGIPHLAAAALLLLLPGMSSAAPAPEPEPTQAAQAAQVTAAPDVNAAVAWWPEGALDRPNPFTIWRSSRVPWGNLAAARGFWTSHWPEGLSRGLGAWPSEHRTRTHTPLVVITPDMWMVAPHQPTAAPTNADSEVSGEYYNNNDVDVDVEPPAETSHAGHGDRDYRLHHFRDVVPVPVPSPTVAPSEASRPAATTLVTLTRA
ncbi:hypothetical protein B0T19DRAFT_468425 [Cercophora scortea]|uniref:Secreted protein n=1 Tax=Cercophora scortea TaxID=314031 RepID=A0AAE0M6C0_9PEZI|nr:hypothetical protein B0T19DRAFT_468425 [Cercophora scortea]